MSAAGAGVEAVRGIGRAGSSPRSVNCRNRIWEKKIVLLMNLVPMDEALIAISNFIEDVRVTALVGRTA
ncbi:hypothetical protein [Nonomuraea insulae]|uniref:Uncharacterized protein n=1 Tax=Nonomuraea insulae TaxID=1616787 RepID=A0ABW1CNY4_9ACTN